MRFLIIPLKRIAKWVVNTLPCHSSFVFGPGANSQLNRWTKQVVCTRLITWDPRNYHRPGVSLRSFKKFLSRLYPLQKFLGLPGYHRPPDHVNRVKKIRSRPVDLQLGSWYLTGTRYFRLVMFLNRKSTTQQRWQINQHRIILSGGSDLWAFGAGCRMGKNWEDSMSSASTPPPLVLFCFLYYIRHAASLSTSITAGTHTHGAQW